MSHEDFYASMTAGATPTTSAVPLGEYVDSFERAAVAGRPVLLLGLSSALSSTHDAALAARTMVLAEPDEVGCVLADLEALRLRADPIERGLRVSSDRRVGRPEGLGDREQDHE